jgi:hypothetical protein
MNYFFEDGAETTEPSDDHIFVGVIEWSSDSAEEPAVTVAHAVPEIRRWFQDQVSRLAFADNDDLDGLPEPPAADCDYGELTDWMDEWREATTEAWLTIYRRKLP